MFSPLRQVVLLLLGFQEKRLITTIKVYFLQYWYAAITIANLTFKLCYKRNMYRRSDLNRRQLEISPDDFPQIPPFSRVEILWICRCFIFWNTHSLMSLILSLINIVYCWNQFCTLFENAWVKGYHKTNLPKYIY